MSTLFRSSGQSIPRAPLSFFAPERVNNYNWNVFSRIPTDTSNRSYAPTPRYETSYSNVKYNEPTGTSCTLQSGRPTSFTGPSASSYLSNGQVYPGSTGGMSSMSNMSRLIASIASSQGTRGNVFFQPSSRPSGPTAYTYTGPSRTNYSHTSYPSSASFQTPTSFVTPQIQPNSVQFYGYPTTRRSSTPLPDIAYPKMSAQAKSRRDRINQASHIHPDSRPQDYILGNYIPEARDSRWRSKANAGLAESIWAFSETPGAGGTTKEDLIEIVEAASSMSGSRPDEEYLDALSGMFQSMSRGIGSESFVDRSLLEPYEEEMEHLWEMDAMGNGGKLWEAYVSHVDIGDRLFPDPEEASIPHGTSMPRQTFLPQQGSVPQQFSQTYFPSQAFTPGLGLRSQSVLSNPYFNRQYTNTNTNVYR